MRASLIALLFVALGAAGVFLFQSMGSRAEGTDVAQASPPVATLASASEARIATFQAVCLAPSSFTSSERAAQAAGFTRYETSQGRLAGLVAQSQILMPEGTFATYAANVGGRDLDIMLSRIPTPQGVLLGCGVYDTLATAVLGPDAMTGLVSGPPETDHRFGASVYRWTRPAEFPGVLAVKLSYFPANIQGVPFSGVGIIVDRIER